MDGPVPIDELHGLLNDVICIDEEVLSLESVTHVHEQRLDARGLGDP